VFVFLPCLAKQNLGCSSHRGGPGLQGCVPCRRIGNPDKFWEFQNETTYNTQRQTYTYVLGRLCCRWRAVDPYRIAAHHPCVHAGTKRRPKVTLDALIEHLQISDDHLNFIRTHFKEIFLFRNRCLRESPAFLPSLVLGQYQKIYIPLTLPIQTLNVACAV
jgi:hypothetical protein